MKSNQCPTEAELVAFADAALSPEQLERIEKHLEVCGACARQVMRLTQLIADIAAPVGASDLDVGQHVAGVMQRLDAAPRTSWTGQRAAWTGVLAALAAAAALVLYLRSEQDDGRFAARGGAVERSTARDVGVELYAASPAPSALKAGSSIRPDTALTAGLRNVASTPAYLLLFAVDSRRVVHWIAPRYTAPGENPAAERIAPQPEERLLPTAAVFEDLAHGPVRIVAVITAEPRHVADIEALPPEALGSAELARRLPEAEIREIVLEVAP